MPASLALKNLGYATPDGHFLFDNLDLALPPGKTGLIGRNGLGKSTLLRLIKGDLTPASGEIVRQGRVRMLVQDTHLQANRTLADLFGITGALTRLRRIETGAATDADLAGADWTLESRFDAAMAGAGLAGITPGRTLGSLSGGQVTRAALAALTFDGPDLILLDEPTNNLDAGGKAWVIDLLDRFRGMALVVSHDRQLLRTMHQIIELTTLGASLYGGNWDAYAEQKALELHAAEHDLADAQKQLKQHDIRVQKLKERQDRKNSTGRAARARNDMPKLLLNAMRERAEKTGGTGVNITNDRRKKLGGKLAGARTRVEILQPFTVTLNPTGLPAGKTVLEAHDLTGGPEGQPTLIDNVSLDITGPARLAFTGVNGSGKTTLLRLLLGDLAPAHGTASINVPHVFLDQHVSLLDPALTVRDNYRWLNPGDGENDCRAALARFQFRADAALQSAGTLSGGQRIRAGLACTIGAKTPPQLLVLDEPTNHLDLDAIAALEAGLSAYDGALLAVSHDDMFLNAIGITERVAIEA